jgi:hypothetical protein
MAELRLVREFSGERQRIAVTRQFDSCELPDNEPGAPT